MLNNLSSELYWLTLTVLMTGLMWIPYILNRMREQGIGNALWDPQGITATKINWADRMMRAHQNAVENLVIFAPLILILHITQSSNELTVLASASYFYSRLIHYIVFTFGIPLIRVLTFIVSVFAQLVLAFTILGIV